MKSPFKQRTLLSPKRIPTPFGGIETPLLELPPIKKPPSLEDRQKKALAHSLGISLTAVIEKVPLLGDWAANSLEAAHSREVMKLLTPEEYNRYKGWDKTYPDVLAVLRTFTEGK